MHYEALPIRKNASRLVLVLEIYHNNDLSFESRAVPDPSSSIISPCLATGKVLERIMFRPFSSTIRDLLHP